MKRTVALALMAMMVTTAGFADGTLSISVPEFRDRMEGAWIGQSAGVAYGWPTEFQWKGSIIPEGKMPKWKAGMINETFTQDDLYVEMTFIDVLDRLGVDVSTRTAGIEFANSRYRLWCANKKARDNIRAGIAAPASAHPKFHGATDDIDYQIEADFSGILAPGLPQAAVDLGETFGRIMNYGDGLYAGQFVGAMYAHAYFESDRVRVVESALRAIPSESRYAQMVRDMLAWHKADPADWRSAWTNAVERYWEEKTCKHVSMPVINVRVNGAMALLGFLWGEGDMDRTMYISTAGGFDSDCNPSTACGVLGTMLGARRLDKYVEGYDRTKKWSFTDYDHGRLLEVCERLTRKLVAKYGGRVETDAAGTESFVIPEVAVRPSAYFDSANPGPVPANERLTEDERKMIHVPQFVFVENGEARCALVASEGVKRSDFDYFTNAVFRCTGARVPILEKVEVEGGGEQWNSISFSVEKRPILKDSAYEVTFPDARTMRITGSDNSVRWALNRILEDRFGVVACLPGPKGTHYPSAKTVAMPAVGWKDVAAYRLGFVTCGSVDPRFQRAISASGRTVKSSHMLRTIYADPKYKEPEWVAKLMPLIKGERKYPANIVKLWEPCFACQEGIDEAVNFILDWMKKNPETTSFSLGVNDCGGFCECDGCKAMNGGSVTEKCRFDKNYPNFSNAYGRWCNAIAERVCKVHPDLMIGFLAYRELIDPPDVKLHPNLVPSICVETLQRIDKDNLERFTALFDAWSEKASHIGIYDYAYGSSYKVPRIYSRLFRDFVALKLTKNPQFDGYMCEYGNPWHEGPKLYMQFKLLWDPAQDLDKLLDRWYRACGGDEAAPYLREFYDLWEEFWMGEEVKKTQWYTGTVHMVYFWFTWQQYCYAVDAERLKRMSVCIDKALAAAERSGNDDQRARMRELAVWQHQAVASALACGAGAVTNPLGELANADDVAFFERNFPRMQKAELAYRKNFDRITDFIEQQADGWTDTPAWRASLAWRFRRVERFAWAQNRMRLLGQYLSFKNGAADPVGKNYVPTDAQPEGTDATVERISLGGGRTGWKVTATGAKPSVKVVLAGDEQAREYFFTTRIRNLSGHALVYKQTADARMPRNGRMLNVPFGGSGKAKKDETAVLNSIYTKYQTFFSETTEIVATVEFNNLGAGESVILEEVAFRLPSKTALKLNTPYTAPVKPGKEKLDMTTFEERQVLEEGK